MSLEVIQQSSCVAIANENRIGSSLIFSVCAAVSPEKSAVVMKEDRMIHLATGRKILKYPGPLSPKRIVQNDMVQRRSVIDDSEIYGGWCSASHNKRYK